MAAMSALSRSSSPVSAAFFLNRPIRRSSPYPTPGRGPSSGPGRRSPLRLPAGSVKRMASVQANGITIEYEQRGDGAPLLMVMGLGGQLSDWPASLIDELVGRGFQVIAYDGRDSGFSTESSAPAPTKRDVARAVLMRRPLR